MASGISSDDVATKVQQWAITMKVEEATGSALPSTKDFQDMCKGPMKNILSFIVEHVRPVKTVNKVRSTVLKRRPENVNDLCSVFRSRQLDVGCAALDSAIAADEADENMIKKLNEKILAKEAKLQEVMSALQLTLERIELLEALARNVNPKIKYMEAQAKTLESICIECSLKIRSTRRVPDFIRHDVGLTFPVLDTTCMKDVIQKACQMQSKITASVVPGKSEPNATNHTKEDFKQVVRKVLIANGPTDVLRCLTELSSIKSSTERAQLQEVTSVAPDLLEPSFEMNVDALMIRAKIESTKAETEKTRAELEEVVKKINARLLTFYAEDTVGIGFEFRKKDIANRLSEVRLTAMSDIQEAQANQLRLEVQLLSTRQAKLEIDFRKIEAEKACMKKLRENALSLLHGVQSSRLAFDRRRRDLKDAFDSALSVTQLECASRNLLALHDRTAIEADLLLSHLPLHLMETVPLLENCTQTFRHELSVARCHCTQQHSIPDLCKMVKAKEALRRDELFLTSLQTSLAPMRNDDASQTLTELAKSLAAIKERKTSHLLPQVRDFLEESVRLVLESDVAYRAVRIWWEQPAQNIELGLEIDATTLGAYMTSLGISRQPSTMD